MNISGLEVIKAFMNFGWVVARKNDGHTIMSKPGHRFSLAIPRHNELKKGILMKLIRHSGISPDEFMRVVR